MVRVLKVVRASNTVTHEHQLARVNTIHEYFNLMRMLVPGGGEFCGRNYTGQAAGQAAGRRRQGCGE